MLGVKFVLNSGSIYTYMFLTMIKNSLKRLGRYCEGINALTFCVWPTWPIKTEFYDGGSSGKSFKTRKCCDVIQ